MFIVLSLVWGWLADGGNRPDTADAVGAAVALAGMAAVSTLSRLKRFKPTASGGHHPREFTKTGSSGLGA